MGTYTPPGRNGLWETIEVPDPSLVDGESIDRFWKGMFAVGQAVWTVSDDHGFHAARKVDDSDASIRDMADSTALMLIVSELGEALEAIRDGNLPSKKIPAYSGAEEELADAVIRVMDLCWSRGWDLAGAILSKTAYNERREHMHGRRL